MPFTETGEEGDTAAYEWEFGCQAGVSVITVSETEQGRGESEEGEGTEGVVGEVCGCVKMDPQFLFFVHAEVDCRVVGEECSVAKQSLRRTAGRRCL